MKRKIIKLEEQDIEKLVKKIIKEEQLLKENLEISLLKKIMLKLKGVSEKQINYNIKNGLPWDWGGSKEGFYEKMEPRKNYAGSN